MEIAKKIALIQNPGLGEFKIRDLNDEINKLLRVKYAWETRIKELGGQDYRYIHFFTNECQKLCFFVLVRNEMVAC